MKEVQNYEEMALTYLERAKRSNSYTSPEIGTKLVAIAQVYATLALAQKTGK